MPSAAKVLQAACLQHKPLDTEGHGCKLILETKTIDLNGIILPLPKQIHTQESFQCSKLYGSIKDRVKQQMTTIVRPVPIIATTDR